MINAKNEDCIKIYEEWHKYAKEREAKKLLNLYKNDAILETPLVMAIFDDKQDGILRGQEEIAEFFDEGLRRRPNDLVRWYRTGLFLTNGKVLTWEYPRQTPDGDQVDIVEVMDIEDGKIQYHRIYWGWFGFKLLLSSAMKNR